MLTAATRLRRFVGDGGSQRLRHPQVPGDDTGLGRRITRGVDVAHSPSEERGGRASTYAAQDAALDRF